MKTNSIMNSFYDMISILYSLQDLRSSQKLVGTFRLGHFVSEVEKCAIRHETTGFSLPQDVSLSIERLSLLTILLLSALVQFFVDLNQLFGSMGSIVLLHLGLIYLHFLTNHRASSSHQMLGHPLIYWRLRDRFHLFSGLIHPKYLIELILLGLWLELLLSFHLFELLIEQQSQFFPLLRRNARPHRRTLCFWNNFLVQSQRLHRLFIFFFYLNFFIL